MFKNLLDKFRKDKLPPNLVPQLIDYCAKEPVSFVRGEGLRIWDTDGNEFIDATAGGGMTVLGHGHPSVSEAISLQAHKLLYIGNRFHSQEQANLADRLIELTELDKVFLCQDQLQARTAAQIIVNRYAQEQGNKAAKLLCLGSPDQNQSPLECISIEFDDLNSVGAWADDEAVVGVMVPPLLCDEGVAFCQQNYLASLRDICDEHQWILIVDESLTGFGRTGRWFGFQHDHILPDMVISGGGMANGLPLGMCATKAHLTQALQVGDLVTTFGGNPLACQAATAVIDVIKERSMVDHAQEMGELLKRKIVHAIGTLEGVKDIRGHGLIVVIEFEKIPEDIAKQCLLEGLIVDVVPASNAIRLTPALLINAKDVDAICHKLEQILAAT